LNFGAGAKSGDAWQRGSSARRRPCRVRLILVATTGRAQSKSEGVALSLKTYCRVSVRERAARAPRRHEAADTEGDEPGATRTKSAPLSTQESPAQARVAESTHQVGCKDLLERPSLFLPECLRRPETRFAPSNIRRYKTRNAATPSRNNRSVRVNRGSRAARRREVESPGYSCRTSRSGCCW
jgi:hypothetical protein